MALREHFVNILFTMNDVHLNAVFLVNMFSEMLG